MRRGGGRGCALMPVLNEFLIALEIMYALFSIALALSHSRAPTKHYISAFHYLFHSQRAHEKNYYYIRCAACCVLFVCISLRRRHAGYNCRAK